MNTRYLQDTQTPEWKKAYIDYRGLKKRITAIRKVHEGLASDSNSGSEEEPYIHSTISETGVPELLPQDDITLPPGHARAEESALQITDADSSTRFAVKNGPRNSFIAAVRRGFGLENRRPVGTLQGELDTSTLGHKVVEAEQSTCHDPTPDDGGETHIPHPERPSTQESVVPRARQDTVTKGRESPILGSTRQKRGADSEKPILIHAAPIEPKVGGVSPSRSVRGRRSSFAYPKSLISGFRKQGAPPSGQRRFESHLLRLLTSSKRVDDNYDRQRVTNPMKHLPLNELLNQLDPTEQAFFTALDAQLDKIDCFYSAREKDMMARTKLLHEQLDELGDHKKLIQSVQSRTPSSWTTGVVVNIKDKLRLKRSHQPITAPYAMSKDSELPGTQSLESDESGKGKMRAGGRGDADVEGKDIDGEKPSPGFERIPLSCDPEDYLYAKKKLKKAVLEHYRGLEVLQNYRIRAQHQYMDEKHEETRNVQ
ncbi:hypothetical protein DXG01_014801 [Tephrocybe rancida]|nr:hypothetical protein DXG01_014801 [Tephrocybe rancida]